MYYMGRLRSALIHFVPIFYPPYTRHTAVLLSVHFGCGGGGEGGGL